MSAVIITGAGGYIGGMLTKKMVENGVKVIAVLHHLTPENFPKSELITMVKANANDPEDLLMNIPTLEYDAFYHLAWAGVNGSEKANPIVQTNNIKMALNCAYVAKKLSCKKFLCAGTVAERAIESLPHLKKTSDGMLYGTAKYCTHLMLETYCKNIELNFLWMQLSNSYGPTNKTGNLVSYALSELLSGREATFGPAI